MTSNHSTPRAVRGFVTIGAAALLLAAAGCGGKKGGTSPKQGGLTLTEAGLGGITGSSMVSTAEIQKVSPDAEIRPDPDNGDILEVWKGGERLYYVVATSSTLPAEGVFNVQVTSASIPGPNGWRVGDNLASVGKLDMCECWSDLRVCFQKGTHVAVAIDHDDCEGLPAVGNVTGRPIARLIWNPKPWPEIAEYEGAPDGEGDGYDGSEDGGEDGEEGDGEEYGD
jgi:hypothetical protein